MGELKTLRQWAGVAPPVSLVREKTALVLIDCQEVYFSGNLSLPEGPAAVARGKVLLGWARQNGIAVIHVRHEAAATSPLFAPDSRDVDFHPDLSPEEREGVVVKHFPSSFHQTPLEELLRQSGIDTLVVAGFMTHMCVESTVRNGLHLGFKCIVAADACTTRPLPAAGEDGTVSAELLHRAALAAMADRFADVLTVDGIVALPLV